MNKVYTGSYVWCIEREINCFWMVQGLFRTRESARSLLRTIRRTRDTMKFEYRVSQLPVWN